MKNMRMIVSPFFGQARAPSRGSILVELRALRRDNPRSLLLEAADGSLEFEAAVAPQYRSTPATASTAAEQLDPCLVQHIDQE